MNESHSGPRDAAEGVVEDVKGKVKDAAGTLTGNEELKREGQAQQDRAAAQREAAGKEAEAQRARGEAEVHRARQAGHAEQK
ncbi:microaggregate-binding protein 1 [Nocardia stercoris]|uniref:CsbD family protein n=1 Tax=Nocardia stercoris TaxID=2483361 RepID=A0A3M2L121_9NOCA|nr:CsbD family protein [Nocardia stercoris]RMI31261.1 CsbD family protein [Nocardia stercoris]